MAQNTRIVTYIIAAPVTASVGTSGVGLSVGTDYGERLWFLEGENTVILQKDDALLADFAHDTVVS